MNQEKEIVFAAKLLEQGEVVAIPTETVYGLAGNAFNESAVQKIFDIKNRPSSNPLIVHIESVEALEQIAKEIPVIALSLAKVFWPGPLTLVLKKKSLVSDLVTAGQDTVAVRVPNHPVTLKLLKMLSFPLAAPSANPFGYISPTTAAHVKSMLHDKVPFVLNGGSCDKGIESTIIGFENNKPVLLRKGAIEQEAIEKISGPLEVYQATDKVRVPGMLKIHYAPYTPLFISDNIPEALSPLRFKRVGLLLFTNKFSGEKVAVKKVLSVSGSMEQAAQNLYAYLHELDGMNLDLILTEPFPDSGLGKAMNDRLRRASSNKNITEYYYKSSN